VVVRGDYALEGIEFFETYSPVAKLESIRLVLALTITHKVSLRLKTVRTTVEQTRL